MQSGAAFKIKSMNQAMRLKINLKNNYYPAKQLTQVLQALHTQSLSLSQTTSNE